jgi:hypothetical protein
MMRHESSPGPGYPLLRAASGVGGRYDSTPLSMGTAKDRQPGHRAGANCSFPRRSAHVRSPLGRTTLIQRVLPQLSQLVSFWSVRPDHDS